MDQPTQAARRRMMRTLTALGVTVALCAAGLAGLRAVDALPDRYKAWTALHLDDPPAPLDRAKLARLGDWDACLNALEQSRATARVAEPLRTRAGCGYEAAVVLEASAHPWSAPQPMVMRCPLAAALYLWERRVVAPAAQAHFGQGVAEIRQYGIYSCRTVNRRPGAALSEHAKANAVDVSGFVLEDGRVISVRAGWSGKADEAAFLRAVHQGGCGLFRGVIGPDGDAAHADHFHFDMGRWRFCR